MGQRSRHCDLIGPSFLYTP